jgi:hypothetical protein
MNSSRENRGSLLVFLAALVVASLWSCSCTVVGSLQMTVTLSLTDSSSNTLWQLALTLNPTSTNFGSVQSSTLNIVVAKP